MKFSHFKNIALAFSMVALGGCGSSSDCSQPNVEAASETESTEQEPTASDTDSTQPEQTGDAPTEASDPPNQEALPAGITELSITQTIDGSTFERRVLLHVPGDLDTQRDYPIVFAFHGNGGNPTSFTHQLATEVESGRFVGVYPEGHLQSWNLGEERSTADEIFFVNAIIDQLKGYSNLDFNRVFATGTSNGAGLSHYLALHTDFFKAIAPIATALTQGNTPGETTAPVSVLQIHGNQDNTCPYNGGESPTGHTFLAAEDSAAAWAMHNGCELEMNEETTPDGNIRIEFQGCANNTRVIHYGITDAGHGIPGYTEGGLFGIVADFFESIP